MRNGTSPYSRIASRGSDTPRREAAPLSERGRRSGGQNCAAAIPSRRGVTEGRGVSHKTLLYLFVLVLTLAGCRSHKDLQRTDKDITETGIAKPPARPATDNLEAIRNTDFATYCANFSCTVEGITVNGQIRMAKDSVIWVSVNKIFELGRAKLTPSRVQVHVKMVNKRFDGNYADLKQKWGIDADYATLCALLTGNQPPDCLKSKEPKRDGDIVTLWYNQNNRQLTLKKDYGSKLLTETEMYSPAAGQRLRCSYGERQMMDGQMLPSIIGVQINSKKINEQTVIKLEKIKLNELQSYPFK